jgi:casein kinase II subunit beta
MPANGLCSQVDKYKKADFGKCPRVICDAHPLLPMGLEDQANRKSVKLYCAKCEDIYNPKSSRHAAIDGAYFGSSFHNILFQVYPALVPVKSKARYIPRIFGFKVHPAAALARWQDEEREEMKKRIRTAGVEGTDGKIFIEDGSSAEGETGGEGEGMEDEIAVQRAGDAAV